MPRANYSCPECDRNALLAEGPERFVCIECGNSVRESLEYLASNDFQVSEVAEKLLNNQ